MHILLTGGAGFIGSHLAERLLRAGHGLTIIDDFNDFYDPHLKRENIEILRKAGKLDLAEGDIRDARLVESRSPSRGSIRSFTSRACGVRPSIKDPQLYVDTTSRAR